MVFAHHARGIHALRKTCERAVPGVIVYGGRESYRLSDDAVVVPWTAA